MLTRYIDIHTHNPNKKDQVLSIYNVGLPVADIPQDILFSAGWHPWQISGGNLAAIETSLLSVVGERKLVALGECGLDRVAMNDWDEQLGVFNLHLDIADCYNKPLIIHCVKAYSDILQILKRRNYRGKILLHGFSGNEQLVKKFLGYNVWFSLGRLLLNPKTKIAEHIKIIPPENLFFETDNDDFSIDELYFCAAQKMGMPVERLIERINLNYNELIGYGLAEQDSAVVRR